MNAVEAALALVDATSIFFNSSASVLIIENMLNS
jgi:hypothetical protein